MRRLVIVSSLLFLAVIAAAIFYFARLGHRDASRNGTIAYIPADAAFLVSFQNDKSFYNIFQDFKVFEALLGNETQHELNYLHQEVLKGSAFAEMSNRQTFFFSFHPSQDKLHWLLTIPLKERLNPDDAIKLLQQTLNGKGKISQGRVELQELKSPLYITFKTGAVLISFDKELAERAADEQQPHLSATFIEEFNTNSNKNNNAVLNLHLNHSVLGKLVSTLTKNKPGNNLQLLYGLKGMSSLNMNFKSDALMFSGLSNIESNRDTYLTLFSNQTAIEEELKSVLPANTSAFASFGFSNYTDFHHQLCLLLDKRKQLTNLQQQMKLLSQSKKVVIDSLLEQWGDEFASIELNTRESIGIVKVKDSTSFAETINKLSSEAAEDVRRFDHANLLYYSFGDPMLLFNRPYFTLVDHYLICANTISTLQQFRNNFYMKRLLVNSVGFLDFNQLRSNKANISFFIHNQNSSRYLNRILRPSFAKAYADTARFGYKDFYGFSFQLSGYNGNFFSNLSIKYNLPEKEEQKAIWKYNLSSTINYPPRVLQFNDSLKFILTQDKSDRLYAISEDGKEWWRTSLDGPILGQIYQLPDKSILLNTTRKLYRFRPDGEPLAGFPIMFPHEATYGLSIFSNSSQKNSIFIPSGNRIYAYDENGIALENWKDKTVDGDILFDIKTTSLAGYQYVIASTQKGKFYLYNHTGSLVKTWDNKQKKEFRNTFGINISPGNPAQSNIWTTDSSGTLLHFYFDDRQEQATLGTWSPQHYFNAVNIQKDSIPELIYIDKNQLYVYDGLNNSLLFNYKFDSEVLTPLYFPTEQDQFMIGVATAAKQLYVFDAEGSLINGFPMIGLNPFYYGKLLNDGRRYTLLSRDGLTLEAFRMK